MKRKTIAGLIAIVAIVVVAMFAGCVEEEAITPTPTLVPTSTPTPTPTSTSTSTPTSTPTPTPEPKYISGDIVSIIPDRPTKVGHMIVRYDKDTDKYTLQMVTNTTGEWKVIGEETEKDRATIDGLYGKIGEIDETIEIPTSTPKPKKWHSVTSFSGSSDKTTQPFTIKGDEWRVKYEVKSSEPEYAVFGAYVYPRGETVMYVSSWDCTMKECSDMQYIYEGNGDYYFSVIAANIDSWNLDVEDYY